MPCAGCSVWELKKKKKSILDMGTTLCARGELELFPLLWQEPVKHRATGHCQCFLCPLYNECISVFSVGWSKASLCQLSCEVQLAAVCHL